jgi:butyrate kinase
MEKTFKVLTINPGSTSTKIAVFENESCLYSENVQHDAGVLKTFKEISDQLEYRKEIILESLKKNNINLDEMDAFVGRGGSAHSMVSGTYPVSDMLLEHTKKGILVQHPANLGCQLARAFADPLGKPSFIVNAPCVDEFMDIARITGFSDIFRTSSIHALNQKENGIRYAKSIGKSYEDLNLIICHIGGGISVTAHQNGRMVDSNDIINGDGPMAPTRAGALPAVDFMKLCYSGKWTEKEMYNRITKDGGLVDHLGTADAREIRVRIDNGDKYAALVYDAMIYQIAKAVGSYAVTLKGKVNQIIFAGGISHDKYLVVKLTEYVEWIAPVTVYPGEFEMEALAAGAIRVLSCQEEPKEYSSESVWNGFNHMK